MNQMFGPPQPAASTNALSAVESSSTSDPKTAAQNLASASASAASNVTVLITLAMPGTVAAAAPAGHFLFAAGGHRGLPAVAIPRWARPHNPAGQDKSMEQRALAALNWLLDSSEPAIRLIRSGP
jgi:hypothetical protein